MFAVIVLLLSAAAAPPAARPRCSATVAGECLQGRWTGPFVGADWTFEFTRSGSVWSGRSLSSKGKGWLPVQRLVLAGNSVTFAIESRPQVTFHLTLDPAADTLSGTVDIGGLHTLPFAASRGA